MSCHRTIKGRSLPSNAKVPEIHLVDEEGPKPLSPHATFDEILGYARRKGEVKPPPEGKELSWEGGG